MTVREWLAALVLCAGAAAATAQQWTSRPLAEVAIFPRLSVPATVVPREQSRLSAEVTGRVLAVPARVGMTLAKGEIVARLDDRSYRIELNRALAQVKLIEQRIVLAKSQLAQSESLADGQFVSSEALRLRRTELAVLDSERDAVREAVAAARLALTRCVVRAPFDGVVRERHAGVGELAVPGTPLIVLAATQGAEVRAQVPLQQLEALRRASARKLLAGGRNVALKIVRVSPLVEAAGQTHEVVLAAAESLPPGLAGELQWTSPDPHLPPEFVQRREGRAGAFVMVDGEPVFRRLEQAESGRPVAVDWPLSTELVDQGRLRIGLEDRVGR